MKFTEKEKDYLLHRLQRAVESIGGSDYEVRLKYNERLIRDIKKARFKNVVERTKMKNVL